MKGKRCKGSGEYYLTVRGALLQAALYKKERGLLEEYMEMCIFGAVSTLHLMQVHLAIEAHYSTTLDMLLSDHT